MDSSTIILFALLVLACRLFSYISDNRAGRGDASCWDLSTGCVPDWSAIIIDINSIKVGSKNNKRVRTIVTFSDGYIYKTEKTKRKNMVMYYSISADYSEILKEAIEAHNIAAEKFFKNNSNLKR